MKGKNFYNNKQRYDRRGQIKDKMKKSITCSIILIAGLITATSFAFQQAVLLPPHRIVSPSSLFPHARHQSSSAQCLLNPKHRVNLIKLKSSINNNQHNNIGSFDKQLGDHKLMIQRIFQNIRRVVTEPPSSKVLTSFVLSLSIFLVILCGLPESSFAAVRSGGRIGGSFGSSSSRIIRHRSSTSRSYDATSPRRNHSNRSRSSRV